MKRKAQAKALVEAEQHLWCTVDQLREFSAEGITGDFAHVSTMYNMGMTTKKLFVWGTFSDQSGDTFPGLQPWRVTEYIE
jgi:hypothetical protein